MEKKKGMMTIGDLMQMGNVKMVVQVLFLHLKFHTDEVVCWWLAMSESFRRQMEEKFPGIGSARAEFWSMGQGVDPAEMADTLSFGCRGGVADEHKLERSEYAHECAATLFARVTGLIPDEALGAVLSKVMIEDRRGASSPDSIHAVLKSIHRMSDDSRPSQLEILHWGAMAYEAEYQMFIVNEKLREENPPLTITRAKDYIAEVFGENIAKDWTDLPTRAQRNAKARMNRMIEELRDDRGLGTKSRWWRTVRCVVNGRPEMVPMVIKETDSYEALKASIELGASIIIIRRTCGNLVVFTDRRKAIDLSTVALALRWEELRMMGRGDEERFTPDELAIRGHVERWPLFEPYWYLQDVPRFAANQLLQGSESAEGVLPTRIPLEQIVQTVCVILGGGFHPRFYRGCIKGVCEGKRCPWFSWNLGRCGNVQFKNGRR